MVGVAVDAAAALGVDAALERVGGLEVEALRQLAARRAGYGRRSSADLQDLVGLQRQPPLRMGLAIGDAGLGVVGLGRVVHRLQQEMLEVQPAQLFRIEPGLGPDQRAPGPGSAAAARRPWG